MIYISNAAQMYFNKLLKKQKKGTQIRVFITNPNTFNAEGGISYCSPDDVKLTDIALKFKQLIVYIDKESIPYLKDAEIDLITDQFHSQLTIKTPNAKPKITENASLIEKIKYLLQSQINPQLAKHGGNVHLVEITEENHAILQFTGSCNGCSMINITLKEWIEKELLNEFPELKGVRDLTEHRYGDHSYY